MEEGRLNPVFTANWYLFSLAALLLIGLQRFLYKVAAASGLSPSLTTLSFMVTVAVAGSLLFVLQGAPIVSPGFLVVISLINSLTFVTATLAHIHVLKRIAAAVAYPLIRLNVLLVVFFAVVFLGEDLVLRQWLGVGVSLTAMMVLAREQAPSSGAKRARDTRGLWLLLLAMLAGALSSISCKFAAEYTSQTAFIALSYIFSSLLTLALHTKLFPNQEPLAGTKKAVLVGILMGILNLAGFSAYLQALSLGPLSLVASINGMHFVVAVALSCLVYKEKLQLPVAAGILLTVLAIVLLRA